MISFNLLLKIRLGLLWVTLAVLLAIPFSTLDYFRKPPPPPQVITFTSGMDRQTITFKLHQPGQYRLVLENANPPWSGYYLQWDYLALKQGNTAIWDIGQSELCKPGMSDCTTTFDKKTAKPSLSASQQSG